LERILYKYRSLENFKTFIDIILKNRLYAAKFKELNDPMEGQYLYRNGELNIDIRKQLSEEKNNLRLCSLSRVNNNELMWSHYANGQRGVAIGVEINRLEYNIRQVQYNGLPYIQNHNLNNQTAIEILSNKLEIWNYEEEERIFIHDKHYINVKVKEIILGRAMSNYDNGIIRDLIDKINPDIRIIRAENIMP
jgi:hypothetical protein